MTHWYSQTVENLSDSLVNYRSQFPLLAAAGVSLSVGFLLRSLLSDRHLEGPILHSPLTSAKSSAPGVDLPLDVLPGARDVQTPYGSIRVYEWGPEDGPKVLCVHGITTPCIALGGLAHALVDRGCRVMLFDLFGRGYSDCPSNLPQDERLFATQIFLALSSSKISWTGAGSGKFCLVGYSLGGGIAASFASFFPQLLSSLVLIAPAGLIRDSQISFQSRLLYSGGFIPERVLGYLVGRRLRAGPLSSPKPKHEKLSAEDALAEELPSQGAAEVQVLSRSYPHVTVPSAVLWQVNHHHGFVHSFMSSMRHGPILAQRQRESWERLGKFLSTQAKLTPEEQSANGLPSDKVLILCGENDPIIVKGELVPDATSALQGNAKFVYFDAGHEFPSTKYEEVAEHVFELLN
ncbi:alpha/beta hydrolase [Aspergillus ochraceoroseus]|nr:alpha/beta hydrolase [Aspergillus ochraceoroseus]